MMQRNEKELCKIPNVSDEEMVEMIEAAKEEFGDDAVIHYRRSTRKWYVRQLKENTHIEWHIGDTLQEAKIYFHILNQCSVEGCGALASQKCYNDFCEEPHICEAHTWRDVNGLPFCLYCYNNLLEEA